MYAMKFLILFLYALAVNIDGVESKLKYVFNIVRHGARSPWQQVVNHVDSIGQRWAGDSELTDRGIRQEFLLGMKMRLRYVNDLKYLSSSFNPEEIEIMSTNTNRTITSAYAYLTGLFPPYTGPVLTQDQVAEAVPPIGSPDQPQIINQLQFSALPSFSMVYPIHIFAKIDQYFSLNEPSICKGVEPIVEDNKNKVFVRDLMKKIDSSYGKVKSILNYTDDHFYDYDSLKRFCDAVVAAKFDKRNLSYLQVNTTSLGKDCKQFLRMDIYNVSLQDSNNFISNMAMTPIMKKFLDFYDWFIMLENQGLLYTVDLPKYTYYSAHDSNLGVYMLFLNNALKLNLKLDYIPYASSILLEFHKLDSAPKIADDSHYVIQIYYNEGLVYNDIYKSFKKAIKPLLIKESIIDDFCGFTDNSGLYYMIAIGCLACTSTGLGVWILLLLFKPKPEVPLLPQ